MPVVIAAGVVTVVVVCAVAEEIDGVPEGLEGIGLTEDVFVVHILGEGAVKEIELGVEVSAAEEEVCDAVELTVTDGNYSITCGR